MSVDGVCGEETRWREEKKEIRKERTGREREETREREKERKRERENEGKRERDIRTRVKGKE